METQKNLESWQASPVGTEDAQKLEAKDVKIVSQQKVTIESKKKVGTTYEKIVFSCKHPDREELLEISDAKYIQADQVVNRATWYMLDSKGGVQKNSALAALMVMYSAKTLGELVGKTVKTAVDEKGYLCLKAY